MIFLISLVLISLLHFNSLLISISIFFFLLFVITIGSKNFSVALISLAGFILTQMMILVSSGVLFLGVSIGIIYAGAILVMILFILILVNNSKFELNVFNKINKSNVFKQNNSSIEILSNGVLLLFLANFFKLYFKKFSVETFINLSVFDNSISNSISKFYHFSYTELHNLSFEILTNSASIFYILGLYISIASILLLSLLKKLYY